MRKYVCTVCGYVYDEAAGVVESGISPGTKWENVPDSFTCPLCGAVKEEFKDQAEAKKSALSESRDGTEEYASKDYSAGELSALFSNLSKGCEKQYKAEEANLYGELAKYYSSKTEPAKKEDFDYIYELVQHDLDSYTAANEAAAKQADRGALRALVWGEKVTKILASVMTRYQKQQEKLLEGTNLYVCEICGFVYTGDEAPEICPVCKVPRFKIKNIERRAQ